MHKGQRLTLRVQRWLILRLVHVGQTISKTLAAARKVAYIRYKDRLCAAIVAMSRKRRKVEFTLTNILGGFQSLVSAAAQQDASLTDLRSTGLSVSKAAVTLLRPEGSSTAWADRLGTTEATSTSASTGTAASYAMESEDSTRKGAASSAGSTGRRGRGAVAPVPFYRPRAAVASASGSGWPACRVSWRTTRAMIRWRRPRMATRPEFDETGV